MKRLTLAELDAASERFDRAALATPDIDHFCSASDWILPAHEALMPPREPWIFEGDAGYVLLAKGTNRKVGTYLQPLEAAWGLACPLVGPNPRELADALAGLAHEHRRSWNLLLLSGVPPRSQLFASLVDALGPSFAVSIGGFTRRHAASLEGGVDGFLSRRTRNLRRSLRRAERDAAAAGVTFTPHHGRDSEQADALFARLLDIERRSWKGRQGVGIDRGELTEFYRRMSRRLIRRGGHRLWLAQQEGRDVGYVLGGVLGRTYRGLQFSFDDDLAALGIGNLLQWHQISELCQEGCLEYDLGTDIAYKQRWGERTFETLMLVVVQNE